MKKIVINLLLLAVYNMPLRASDNNATEQPSIKISQGLLDKAQQTLDNPLVKQEEKVKVQNALNDYNQEQTKKTRRVLNGAIDRAQPGAREAQKEADRIRNAKPEVRAAQNACRRVRLARPEIRAAQNAAQRARLENPEVRAAKNAATRIKNENPAARAAKNAAERARRANMSETQRINFIEASRARYANMTEVQKTAERARLAKRRANPEIRAVENEAERTRYANMTEEQKTARYEAQYRRKVMLRNALTEDQQREIVQMVAQQSSAAPEITDVAPHENLEDLLANISFEQLMQVLQEAQVQQVSSQSNSFVDVNIDELTAELRANELEQLTNEGPDLDVFNDIDDVPHVQSSSGGNFFGEEDLRSRLLVPQSKTTARVQALGRSSDARAQQLAQRRRSSSDDESEYEEPELSGDEVL